MQTKTTFSNLNFVLIFFSFSTSLIFSQSFTTTSFSASINNTQTPYADVESTMDSEGNIHIGWIKSEGSIKKIMYSFYDAKSKNITTYVADTGFDADSKLLGNIVTNNNKPYITFLCKRDKNAGTKNGNYAVMLLSDPEGDGSFGIEQVSTNPLSPLEENDDLYSSYVNGRPTAHFSGGTLIVSYIADANSKTSWDNYMISATKSGSGWSYNQEFNTDELEGTYSVQNSMSQAKDANYEYRSFIEISNYTVRYMYKKNTLWQEIEVGDYGTVFGNKHTQLIRDSNNKTHLFWYNTENEKFCHTILNGGTYGDVEELKITHSAGGNFMPATIDKKLNTIVYHYQRSFSKDEYIIVFNEDGSAVKHTIPDNEVGAPYGRRSLFAKDGNVYLITASKSSNKIYITTNNGNENLNIKNEIFESINIFPNPTTSIIKIDDGKFSIKNIEVYNVIGKKVMTSTKNELNLENLENGIYILKVKTIDGKIATKRIIKN